MVVVVVACNESGRVSQAGCALSLTKLVSQVWLSSVFVLSCCLCEPGKLPLRSEADMPSYMPPFPSPPHTLTQPHATNRTFKSSSKGKLFQSNISPFPIPTKQPGDFHYSHLSHQSMAAGTQTRQPNSQHPRASLGVTSILLVGLSHTHTYTHTSPRTTMPLSVSIPRKATHHSPA